MSAYILIWSQVEVNLAISSSSAPALKPLLKSFLRGSKNESSDYGRSASNGNVTNSKTLASSNGRRIFGGNNGESGLNTYGKNTLTSNAGLGSANTSQEKIMPQGGIMRTTDVKIDIEMGNMKRIKSDDSEESLRRLEFGQ